MIPGQENQTDVFSELGQKRQYQSEWSKKRTNLSSIHFKNTSRNSNKKTNPADGQNNNKLILLINLVRLISLKSFNDALSAVTVFSPTSDCQYLS